MSVCVSRAASRPQKHVFLCLWVIVELRHWSWSKRCPTCTPGEMTAEGNGSAKAVSRHLSNTRTGKPVRGNIARFRKDDAAGRQAGRLAGRQAGKESASRVQVKTAARSCGRTSQFRVCVTCGLLAGESPAAWRWWWRCSDVEWARARSE